MLKQLPDLDRWFGAHQKIDRLARRELRKLLSEADRKFPLVESILKFEGRDGPDGIKLKAPAQDEPWHFYDPHNPDDTMLLDIIAEHQQKLVAALRNGEKTQASFQAAWLAHAVVDGLTPAHQYPYEQEMEHIRGSSKESRSSKKDKLFVQGETKSETVKKNWLMWGDKGLLATHLAFEMGVALVILPVRLRNFSVSQSQVKKVKSIQSFRAYYQSQARAVAELGLYEQFYRSGWTPRYAKDVRRKLVPLLVEAVALAWYATCEEAKKS